MRKISLLLIIFVASVATGFSQEDLDTEIDDSFFGSVIRSRGYSWPYTNVAMTQPYETVQPLLNNNNGVLENDTSTNLMVGVNLFGFHYGLRKNVVEMSANQSFSVGLYPALKASWYIGSGSSNDGGDRGFGEFNVPILFEYNYGNVAGWDSDLDKGFVAGVGIDVRYSGIFMTNDAKDSYRNLYVTSMFKIGYRYWGRSNNAKEINLKVGYGFVSQDLSSVSSGASEITDLTGFDTSLRALNIEFVWTKFLNY